MDSLVEELDNTYSQLKSYVDKANMDSSIKSLEKLKNVASEVGKSWSGSWIGYQSRIYYKDFIAAPAGAHFSSEWGTYQDLRQSTRGDWKEYQFDYVTNYIKTNAENPDLEQANRVSKSGQVLFDDMQITLISIFETYLLRRSDPFIENQIEQLKSMKILSGSDWIESIKPHGAIMSRDRVAISQGILTPPHIAILAEIFDIRNPNYICGELAKQVKIAISHIERQEKEVQKMKRVGTKVFIGHGGSLLWKDLKDFIEDRLHLPWDEFNRVPVAGITNTARLSEMLDNAAIAFLVMTAEDEQVDGNKRARMNVIHEAGLFQGRLGFAKAIVLLEDGCEEFSNIEGLGQIRFPKGNIGASFEEIRRVLEREKIINE